MVKNLPQTCLHSHSYLKLITDRLRKIGKRRQRKKHRERKGEIQGAREGYSKKEVWELGWRQRRGRGVWRME